MAEVEKISEVQEAMKEMMPEEGVAAQIVKISADGNVTEHKYDSTPARNSLVEIMGGQVSIVGMYASQNVIVLRLQNPADKPVNSMTLPEPFHEDKINGPIALVKMNFETTDAEDYSAAEFEALQKMDPAKLNEAEEEAHKKRAEIADAELAEAGNDGDEEEEYEEEDIEYDEGEGEEEGDLTQEEVYTAKLTEKIVAFYQEQHNRAPTMEELKESMKEVLKAMQNGTAEYDEEEGDENAGEKRKLEEANEPEAKKQKTE